MRTFTTVSAIIFLLFLADPGSSSKWRLEDTAYVGRYHTIFLNLTKHGRQINSKSRERVEEEGEGRGERRRGEEEGERRR